MQHQNEQQKRETGNKSPGKRWWVVLHQQPAQARLYAARPPCRHSIAGEEAPTHLAPHTTTHVTRTDGKGKGKGICLLMRGSRDVEILLTGKGSLMKCARSCALTLLHACYPAVPSPHHALTPHLCTSCICEEALSRGYTPGSTPCSGNKQQSRSTQATSTCKWASLLQKHGVAAFFG